MSNLVSIVMASYNGEKYISKQLESLINQTRRPDEIIICDDCSKDNTVAIIEEILGRHGINFTLVRHVKNEGVVASFKEALLLAKGEYIFLCDQDDVWVETKIEKFLDVFHKTDAKMVFSDAQLVDNNLVPMNKTLWQFINFDIDYYNDISDKKNEIKQSYFVKEMVRRNIFTGMCMAFHQELLTNFYEFSIHMLHDEHMGWLAIKNGAVVPINETLVLYRQHSGNVVGSRTNRRHESKEKTIQYIKKSSMKSYGKFLNVKDMNWTGESEKTIIKACDFYKWRVSLFGKRKLRAFTEVICHFLNRDYKKYTSKTEKAMIKDIYITL